MLISYNDGVYNEHVFNVMFKAPKSVTTTAMFSSVKILYFDAYATH